MRFLWRTFWAAFILWRTFWAAFWAAFWPAFWRAAGPIKKESGERPTTPSPSFPLRPRRPQAAGARDRVH